MCYDPGKISLTEITAIKEWVEGPKHILDATGIDETEVVAMLNTGIFDGYLVDDTNAYHSIRTNVSKKLEAFSYNPNVGENMVRIKKIKYPTSESLIHAIYEVGGSVEDVIRFVQENDPYAVLVSGSAEEEVGLKSFDDLDQLFEFLTEQD